MARPSSQDQFWLRYSRHFPQSKYESASFTCSAIRLNSYKKWKPSDRDSILWYTLDDVERLIARNVAASEAEGEQAPLTTDFVSQFAGLSSSPKRSAVLAESGLTRTRLSDLRADGKHSLDHEKTGRLLRAMQENSKKLKPTVLGLIGKAHVAGKMIDYFQCEPDSIVYKKAEWTTDDGIPAVAEAWFGTRPMDDSDPSKTRRKVITGINWSPGIADQFSDLESEWSYGLASILDDYEVNSYDPVFFCLHFSSPKVAYTDRGKTSIKLDEESNGEILQLVKLATAKWKRQQDKEERRQQADERREQRRQEELSDSEKPRKLTVKAACYAVMSSAYLAVSGPDNLPAQSRQIMYEARGKVLELSGATKLTGATFANHIREFMEENPEQTKEWDVVFDARGKMAEPHTEIIVPLGTIDVRNHLAGLGHRVAGAELSGASWEYPTIGPTNRYSALLFIEKEGFGPLFKKTRLAERYDIAIISTKGQTVVAARHLVDELCGRYDIPLFVLHDFDKAGFSILHTLKHDNDKYEYNHTDRTVIDLGLRLEDIVKHNLRSEPVEYGKSDPTDNLIRNGATKEEAAFLCDNQRWRNVKRKRELHYYGNRVELNAFNSRAFVDWIESKLEEHGVQKVVPDNETLRTAYVRAAKIEELHRRMAAIRREVESVEVPIPDDLESMVRGGLADSPASPWDAIVADLADEAGFPQAH